MRIENLKSETIANRKKVFATIIWEDNNRDSEEVFFETDTAFGHHLNCNPNAFLIAGAIPAMHYGEKRVLIDAEVCPELRQNLIVAMEYLRYWFGPERDLPAIQTRARCTMPEPRTPERAGFFFSGGVDSFTTLRMNLLNFPTTHPWSLREGLLVYGLEMDKPEAFEHVVNYFEPVCEEIGITLIPVYSNHYLIYRNEDAKNDFNFWSDKFMSAALAAVVHAFSNRFTAFSIASAADIPNLFPHGSHPLLDPNYSSSDLRIRFDGVNLSRCEKTKIVASWDIALDNLRVCNQYQHYSQSKLNCGRCEKCVRTMLALSALDKLNDSRAFDEDDVSDECVEKFVKLNKVNFMYYKEIMAPLQAKGYNSLANIINEKLNEYFKLQNMKNWRFKVDQFKNQYLINFLTRLKRLIAV